MENQNRRNFLKKAAVGSVAAISIPEILCAGAINAQSKIALSKDDVILFQGDSITDAGRNRDVNEANSPRALGNGYAFLTAANLLYKKPGMNLRIYNKGISGNKVFQLAERWNDDALALKPTVLSLLVGVNDYWHTKRDYDGTVEKYRNDYRELIVRTKKELPGVKLIIGEPFAVSGVKAVDESWYPEFNGYRKAAREIADQFGAVFIPYQSIFDKATKSVPGVYWTHDGVHPSLAGANLMAMSWMEAIK